MNEESRKWLYQNLRMNGFNVGNTYEDFAKLMDTNEESRKWAYDRARELGYNVGKDYAQFNSLIGPKVQQTAQQTSPKPTAAPKPSASTTPAPSSSSSTTTAPNPADATVKPTVTSGNAPKKEEPKLTPVQQMGFSMAADQIARQHQQAMQDFNTRMENIRKGNTMGHTAERTFNPQTGKWENKYYTVTGEEVNSPWEQSHKNLEWRDNWEATTPEGKKHREQRMEGDFQGRVGAVMDKFDPDNAAEAAWQQAEQRTRAAMEKHNEEIWNSYAALGGGRENRIMATGEMTGSNMVDRMTYHDLQRMADDAWNGLGKEKQQAITSDLYDALRNRYPEATDEQLRQAAAQMARRQSDQRMFDLAVEKNAPKSATEYFFRKALEMNSVLKLTEALARSKAGTTGDWEARDVAEQQYEKGGGFGRKAVGVGGTVTGFIIDPLTVLSAGFGSGAVKGATWAGTRIMGEAATRKFATTLGGRLTAGAIGGGVNFGTYEAGSEAIDQLRWGGKVDVNPETGHYEVGAYSPGAVAKQGVHGLLMGSVTGTVAPMIGNVSDKLVRATGSTAGKLGIRTGELAVGTVAEGTIFSAPEFVSTYRDYNGYINSLSDKNSPNYIADEQEREARIEQLREQRGDAMMDVWTDNMAMMAGFKGQHLIKSAPRRIAELATTPKDRFGHDIRAGFETRLRASLDGNRRDLALTADEKRELQEGGYGDLNEFVEGAQNYMTNRRADAASRDAEGNTRYEEVSPDTPEGVVEGSEALPLGRAAELMNDPNISEAARAKMYYYLTGNALPMSTVMGSNVVEVQGEDGKTRYNVQSIGANGVITSRMFDSKRRADVEVNAINRQAELNSVDVGERYYDNKGENKRMYEACEAVSGESGAPAGQLYKMMRRDPDELNEVERRWAERILRQYDSLGDKYSSAEVRTAINREFGVDVDKAIRKEPGNRSEQEQKAVEEYGRRLFADVRRDQGQTRQHYTTDPDRLLEDWGGGVYDAGAPDSPDTPDDPQGKAWQRGHEADAQERRDIAMELAADDPNNVSHAERQEAWNGVVQRINEDAAYLAAQQRDQMRQMQHSDGNIHPATLKEKDDDGNDRTVYIVDGNVNMTPDGTMVDPETSDHSVVVYDPATGERTMLDPSADTGIMSLGEVTTAADMEAEIQHGSEKYVQSQIDEAQGTVRVEPGQVITLPTGEQAQVLAIDGGGENITVSLGDGTTTSVQLLELQRASDEAAAADYRQRHGIEDEQPTEADAAEAQPTQPVGRYSVNGDGSDRHNGLTGHSEQAKEGAPTDYEGGMEITVRDDDGTEKPAMVMGRVRFENGKFEADEDGNIVEYLMDGEVHHENIGNLNDKVTSYLPSTPPEVEVRKNEETPTSPTPPQAQGASEPSAPVPVGEGVFGNIYDQFKGKVKEAVDFLKRIKSGEAKDVLWHNDIGNISLVWGNENYGLAHILAKHPNVLDGLQEHLNKMSVVSNTDNRIVLESDTHRAVVSKMLGENKTPQWLLTAYEKKNAPGGSSDIVPGPQGGMQNGTASLQDNSSDAKLGNNPESAANISEKVSEGGTRVGNEAVQEPMPMNEDGDENWLATTPQRAHSYIFGETGLSRSEGNAFISAQQQAAANNLSKAKAAPMPKMGTSIKKYNEAKAKRQQKIDEAQSAIDYWQQVRDIQNGIARQEAEQQAALNAQRHDEAVAQAQADYEARKQAEAERKEVGNENPMPGITDKWNTATKIDGNRDEIVLPNGERLKGHYVLHESGASSPSHDPTTWRQTDGFPMDANDNSVNDRDYEHDRDAQQVTQNIAKNYDQRALQTPVVVSQDGVVLSGNGRTMAGELAARDNTDGAYVDYLKEYAPKYGFTSEQVGSMQHPRVSFVPDEKMPYTAETFAKFNQQEMKSQNKTEQAVKLGKTVGDDTFRRIVSTINGYDTLGDFYNDPEASLGAVYDLHSAGVIPQAQLAEMVDGARGQERLSAVGREMLENMLIGKAFGNNPEVVRMLTAIPSMRQSVITALGEISDNIGMGGDWSLQDALADAVKLCYNARNSGYQFGDIISTYARQGELFADPDQLQTVADFNNATMLMLADVLNDKRVTLLKTTLALYNDEARQSASGQMDLFSGGIRSREDILRGVIKYINDTYGRKKELSAATAAAVERRKAESVQQDGTPPAGSGESESPSAAADGQGTVEPSETPQPTPPVETEDTGDHYKPGEKVMYHGDDFVVHKRNADGTYELYYNDTDNVQAYASVREEALVPKGFRSSPIGSTSTPDKVEAERQAVNTEPSEAQKEAGNYKKGHIKVDGYDIAIENPKGSTRSGKDASGKEWSITMNYDYGYIKGTEGVDGDHIDVYLSDNPTSGNVYVVDQINQQDGSFDEHKVIYGFPSMGAAIDAYKSQYEDGWKVGTVTEVSREDFKKWVESSHRKTKPFAEYKANEEKPKQSGEGESPSAAADGQGTVEPSENVANTFYGGGTVFATKKGASGSTYEFHTVMSEKDGITTITVMQRNVSTGKDNNSVSVVAPIPNGWELSWGDQLTFSPENGDEVLGFKEVKIKDGFVSAKVKIRNSDGVTEFYDVKLQPHGYRDPLYDDAKAYIAEHGNEGNVIQDLRDELHITQTRAEDLVGRYDYEKSHDRQGNPVDANGKLKVDKVETVDDITDVDFTNPGRSVELPKLPTNVDKAIGANGKPVIIKKNIFEKNGKSHPDVTPEQSRDILKSALYNPTLYGQNQKKSRPHNWVVINTKGIDGRNRLVLLETNTNKNNVEIVHWHYIDARGLEKIKKQAVREDGQLLILPSENSKEAGALSSPTDGSVSQRQAEREGGELLILTPKGAAASLSTLPYSSSSERKGKQSSSKKQEKSEKKNEGQFGLVSDKRMEELKKRLRSKLNNLNMGVDPEVLAIGLELTAGYIDRGVKRFADYAKAMIADLGDVVRPYLKAFYNGVRDMPEITTNGLDADMDDYEAVSKFNVATIGKEGEEAHPTPLETAEQVSREQTAEREAAQAKETLKTQRNEQRKDAERQAAADTEAAARQGEAVASETESQLPSARDEGEVNGLGKRVDDALEKVNEQLALLGYYEADTGDPKQFNESYGYMRTAEKKAVKNVSQLCKTLITELGIKDPEVTDARGKRVNNVRANIAPAGGDVTMRITLDKDKGVELYMDFTLEPADRNISRRAQSSNDDLELTGIMYRVEVGGDYLHAVNNFLDPNVTLQDMLKGIRRVAKQWLPSEDYVAMAGRIAAENASKEASKPSKGGKSKKKSLTSQQPTMPDLFSGLFDNAEQKDKDNGLQRTDELRPGGLPSDRDNAGEHPARQGAAAPQERESVDRGREERGDSRVPDGDAKPVRPRERLNQRNNHAERDKDYAPKGTDERIEANIAAIELAHTISDEGRTATPQEMQVLRRFSGWGGLGKAFKEPDWQTRNPYYDRLRKLLSDDEWREAEMSRNSAYFTPAPIIDTMWDVARIFGFKGGNVLEGSAGIGNIIGLMPMDMSDRSHIHAVEIDSTTGNMLSLLYPDAQVDVQGFEQTKIRNGSVDLAITNVPFVTGLHVNDTTGDKDLSRKFGDIHDFCIAKNVRKLKPGGIGIFITSSGTMDKSQKLRDWLVSEGDADVVGAFRMNNETFGGTSATSDIIVIRKRVNGEKSPMAIDVSKVGVERIGKVEPRLYGDKTQERPIDYNQYFIDHPENMGGRMYLAGEKGDTYRPLSKGLYPVSNVSQQRRMEDWVKRIGEEARAAAEQQPTQRQPDTEAAEEAKVYEALGPDVKEGSMLVDKSGKLCVASYGEAVPLEVNANKVKGHTKVECFNAYKRLKEAVRAVLDYQTQNDDDQGLKPLLQELNRAYDSFVNTYGHLNKNTAISFLKNDMDYSGVAALESFKEYNDSKGKRLVKYGKSDIFKQRVVEKEAEPHPTTVKDGVITSIYRSGRIDLGYIASELGQSEEAVKQAIINEGLGFEDPVSGETIVSYEYLSGNVREKLRQAQEQNDDGRFGSNIKALEKVLPMSIPAHLIEYSLGSSWLDPDLYEQYIEERTGIKVRARNIDGTWAVDAPSWGLNNEKNRMLGVKSDIVGKTVWGHELIIAAMKNTSLVVQKTEKHSDGTTETISDKEATRQCGEKIDEIRQDFKDWARGKMQQDPEMGRKYEERYNDQFNNYVPKRIPDTFVPQYFSGATHKITLRAHQAKAAIRGTTQNVLLAHEVGSGKTFTLITTAMEMRRLGTARKPMVVVQNATVGQFVASAKFLYPNAKILTIEDKDRNAEGRKAFYAKIKYNDWDMIVIPQSVLDKIPDSDERQLAFIQAKVTEKEQVLQQMAEAKIDDPIMTRRAQKKLESLHADMNKIAERITQKKRDGKKAEVARQNATVRAQEMLDRKVDDVENFDDMGIDALLVDEAHEYKHLGFATAMERGVKGVDSSDSKKCQGVYLKSQSVMERTGGKNIIFATGTPISNTAAEIWTFMKYLMPEQTMKDYGIYYFDDFVRNFGDIAQVPEFNTSGKFVQNNRFKGYQNLPELVRIWSGVSDTVLSSEVGDLQAKIPELKGGKAQDVYLPQTRALRSVMKYVRKRLEEFEQMSGREKKENSHIPVTMYSIANSAAVDPRLVMDNAEDDPKSKTNSCVRETLKALDESKSYQGTVAIFSDHYKRTVKDEFGKKHVVFNLFDDIKAKLVKQGVPADQIAIIKPGMKVDAKTKIFDKVNAGQVRVVLGSTATLGTGVNMQERLYTLIHLDAPNRPMDYTQRMGRILRQGNLHKEWGIPVKVIRFGVEDSLDVTAYQRLKTKGAIADSIMHGKDLMANSMENRTLEEEEDQFGDTVAQLSGSEYALLNQQAERELRKYQGKKKQWEADQVYIHAQKPRLQGQIKAAEQRSAEASAALKALEQGHETGITVGKKQFANVEAMGDFIKDFNKKVKATEDDLRNNRSGSTDHKLTVTVNGHDFQIKMHLGKETETRQQSLFEVVKRKMTYSCPELSLEDVPVKGGLLRNALEDIEQNVITGNDFRDRKERADNEAERLQKELTMVTSREGKPFEYGKELEEAESKVADYTAKMKVELDEKQKKYAAMDAGVDAAKDVNYDDDEDDDASYHDGTDLPVDDRLSQRDYLLGNDYASVLTGEEFSKGAEPLTKRVAAYYAMNYGGKVERSGVGTILLDERGVKDSVSHGIGRNKPIAFAAVPEIIGKGAIIDRQEDWKGRGYGSVTFAAPVRIGTEDYVGVVVAKELKVASPSGGTHRFYLHEVALQKSLRSEEFKTGMDTGSKQGDVAKLLRKIVTASESAEKDARAKRREAESLSQKLNTPIDIIDDATSITHENPKIQQRRRRSKGWYDRKTGVVHVVLPNNKDVEDVAATIAHETIAHKGLRELVGEERYDAFLDEVHDHLNADLKKQVDDEASRTFLHDVEDHGEKAKSRAEHQRRAVDELFGRMAEKPFEEMDGKERTLWQRLKAAVRRLLDKFLGTLKLPKWFELGDNELRYMLWRSKERLVRGREHPIDMARDIVKRRELGLDDAVYNMGEGPETFATRQKKAALNKGTVMGGLNGESVRVVDVPRHQYTGSIKEATQQAIDAAKKKYVKDGEPIEQHYSNFGQAFDYIISGSAIEESLNPKQQAKSENKGVHLAVVEHLDEVIGESIEVEEHPDYIKNEHDERTVDNINDSALMHRFYGAISVEGKPYRVMTLMREDKNTGNGVHAYEVTKVEVLNEKSPSTPSGGRGVSPTTSAKLLNNIETSKENDEKVEVLNENPSSTTSGSYGLNSELEGRSLGVVNEKSPSTPSGTGGLNSELEATSAYGNYYPIAKLLKDVEKSYDKGKKLLDESKKSDDDPALYRLRESAPPVKTGIGYKVFVLKDGKLYPPMVANPGGAATPVGVWLDADAAPVAGVTKTGRMQVKAGGKGTQGGSGKLAYRPGWHLGTIPYALQFNRLNPETGQKELFPKNFVFAEVEYANDVDYQDEAMSYGMNKSGKFQHSLAGLPRVPENGSYMYRTNPDPRTDPWIITGAMRVKRILTPTEVDGKVRAAGREPQPRQEGAVTDEQITSLNNEIGRTMREDADMKRREAEALSQKLNTPIDIIDDATSITHENPKIQQRRRRSKGWYDRKTGVVHVVLPNNKDVEDVAATIAHETIAHKGLRELVGEERYDAFLDEVHDHLNADLKKQVDDEASRTFLHDVEDHGEKAKSRAEHQRRAVDELFGRMAEKPFEEMDGKERTLWQRLKAAVRRLLDKFLGTLKLPKWFELGDNELRYMLWRSKERLVRGREHPIDMARDIVKRRELGLDDAVYNMGEGPEPPFASRRGKAVRENGYVHAGLNGAEVRVVTIKDKMPFDTSKKTKALKQDVLTYAKEHGIVGTMTEEETKGKGKVTISNTSIEKMVDDSASAKSVDRNTHLAIIPQLREVIAESVMAETHPDYIKGEDGMRSPENGYNGNMLIHRCYGAADIDGTTYRVKITLKEDGSHKNAPHKAYTYEVTKIELLDSTDGEGVPPTSYSSNSEEGLTTSGSSEDKPRTALSDALGSSVGGYGLNSELEGRNLISLAKLLKDVEKSYDKGKKLLDESKKSDDDTALYRDPDETEDIWRDGSMGLDERITAAATRLAANHQGDKTLRNDAMRAIGGNLSKLRQAMSLQRTFDMTTVKRVSDLAKVLINGGYLSGLSSQEVKRLLAAVKNSTGAGGIGPSVQKVMDIMVDNQLKNAEATLHQLETIKGSKVDARGVEVQGQLDVAGQRLMKAMKEAQKIILPSGGKEYDDKGQQTGWGIAMESVNSRISSADAAIADEAATEYHGMVLAKQWFDDIASSKLEEAELRKELKDAAMQRRTQPSGDEAAYRQYVASVEDAIRQNKIERAEAYTELVGRITDSLRESIANAQAFKEAEKERIGEIHHNANSDMEGRASDEHYRPKFMDKFVNNSFVQFLFSPLGTFDQMLRMFGGKSANGEGYLYNRYMRGWVDARQKEIKGVREKYAVLDAKAAELFGGRVKNWSDLIRYEGKLPRATVTFWDGGEMRAHELTQGNLLYIYMVNKMLDGRMKLRKMGITEEAVATIAAALAPRLIDLADWLQDEFLVETRNEYNETHKRMFGASMAAVEHYFPLKILANARADKPEDLDNPGKNDGISTATGSIIKRRRNALALDLTNADALHVILDHVAEMEHWNAFAEFNRDLNTLRTYKRFRNQVQNMTTIYGSGTKLWKKFNDVCQMASGTYRPPRVMLDTAATNFAKGVTAAKVSFRIFTALKQFLSAPAYIPEARADYLLADIVNPAKAWKWCMKNLPIFNERWHSRMAGDPRLMKTDIDWRMWRTRFMTLASRVGMSPNAFVDALTVAIGAHSMYKTRLAQYLRDGYEQSEAEHRANQDAEILYNQTQQSSEGPFTSTMQVDRSWLSVMFTVFRNASMAYQRQLHDAFRNFKHNLSSGGRARSIAFMKKQLMRDGIEEGKAEESARRKFGRQLRKDVLRVATFGGILQFFWNLGAYLPYLLLGDDDKEKDSLWKDIAAHTLFGWLEGLTGGDVMSQAGDMLVTGDGNPAYLSKDMPLTSDIVNALQKFGNGEHADALNDIVNIVVQSGIGVNPQSITDAVLAIMDACGDDPELAHEAAICVGRILQVPQSQLDKMYFDEVGLSGDEVSKYTPAQLAERYAKYRVKRGRFIAPWSWGDDEKQAKYADRANSTIKERVGSLPDDAVNDAYAQYEEVYKGFDAKVKAAKKAAKSDYVEAARQMSALQQDPDFATYSAFKQLDGGYDKIVGLYLGSKSAEEAALCRDAVASYKTGMVKVLGTSGAAQQQAMTELTQRMQTFTKSWGALQKK